MNRIATSQFDSFDPEVIEAARDVASRVGVPLEAWIASVVPQHQMPVSLAKHGGLKGAPETTIDGAEPATGSDGISALRTRLDGLDRSLEAEQRAATQADKKRQDGPDTAIQVNPVQEVAERLDDIERRVAELGDEMADAKPAAKRGKAAAEMREAVQAIRQRQRELSDQAQPAATVATMHRDLARRLGGDHAEASAGQARPAGALPTYVIEELQREATRVRETIAPLPTVDDVTSLENALDSLAANIDRARSGAEVPALALPLAVIRTRLGELDLPAGAPAHDEVAAGIRKFSKRLDMAIAFDDESTDKPILDALSADLADLRGAAAGLAAPERLGALNARVQELGERIAKIPAVEETAPAGRPAARSARPVGLAGDIDALVEKMDSLQARADFDAGAKRAVVPPAAAPAADPDMTSIRAMLHSLAEKVDRVGERAGPEGLDALEKQVLTLVDKIEAPRSLDPALSSLERTMNDLMHQVEALRDGSPGDAAIERAARAAVAETLKVASVNPDHSEFGLLRASLADMQARQIASDERLSATLEGVQSALDRLVTRLGAVDAPPALRVPSLDERLMTTTSAEAARAIRRPSLPDAAEVAPTVSPTDILLEPGMPRPGRAAVTVADKREAAAKPAVADKAAKTSPGDSDIKTSFIAAARRAAQAAQAELAAEMPNDRGPRSRPTTAAPVVSAGRMSRLRSEIDQHRKPLLLGLAAIVLTLGALQAIGLHPSDDTGRAPQLASSAGNTSAEKGGEPQKTAEAVKPTVTPEQAAAVAAGDPVTTQAIGSPRPQEAPAAQAKPAIPQVPNMAGLAGDLGNVPPSLAKVKQAALAGDGSAVWDLAMREADGRGMPRDLAAAAKLFEKLANVGYAPAQYKLGAHYEKGSGIGRDLAQAKLWYGRAAEQGHARAMHNLGVIYAENPAAGGKPDFASAASWFRQGAEHGVRDSQYNIAVLYARGMGLTQDLVQSYAWFAAAAAQGDEDAGKKRDDVATKLSAPDLARAKSLAASFKPRRLDPAVNEPPVAADAGQGPVSLLGAPTPTAMNPQSARKAI